MTPKERNEIRELAAKKHRGNIDAAVCDWLGVSAQFRASGNKVPHGNAGAVFNIKDELEKYEEQDTEDQTPPAANKGDKAD